MLKKILPIIMLTFISACADLQPASQANIDTEISCCEKCKMCKEKKKNAMPAMKAGEKCEMCEKAKKAAMKKDSENTKP